ncbi:MAG: WecB/TagA/CpsF family glycosyltransferase [Rubrivivax sp.]|nr:WecB/TagA/CpsF family glycosyltransferase [Rubrivivax sp.]
MIDTRIRIFYPADPLGVVPGGVDTFLRGLIKWAPADLQFSLVGMSTDPQQRPVGRWTRCRLGEREFEMHPVCAVHDAGTRGRIPLSVRFMAGVNRDRLALSHDFDGFDFHRIEPALMWSADLRPKNHFFHQDPRFVREQASDNLWRHMPAVYERLERAAMQGTSSAWCVRESGVQALRERYPDIAEHVRFISTWVDTEVFHPVTEQRRRQLRASLAAAQGLSPDDRWLISVGRLDTQKNPQLLLEAFARARAAGQALRWIVVGDGVLRPELQRRIAEAGLGEVVHFLGLQPPAAVADWLRASDVFGLSSAYEGMPMALLEALGCGLPAVATDVGEVRRVMREGSTGRLLQQHEPEALAAALADVLRQPEAWRAAAAASVESYLPQRVLQPVYENYRERCAAVARLRAGALRPAEPQLPRHRQPVVGVPVDVTPQPSAIARLLDWSVRRESRYVCFVNVHSAVQATNDVRHRWALAGADLVAPDGAPIAWTLRAKGHAGQPRIDGPGTMWALLDAARRRGVRVGLYGAQQQTLDALRQRLAAAFPGLQVSYAHAPPFRELSAAEDEAVCREITASGIGLLFVSLGCPKQEFWMAAHRGRLPCVMLGVGAAFDFHAGLISRAPPWMRENGLEWLHRLASQPGRLWRRYAYTNSLFVAKSLAEMLRALLVRIRIAER